MKGFLKMVLASMVGIFLAGCMVFVFVLMGLLAIYIKENKEMLSLDAMEKPILEVELDSEIVERVEKYPLNLYEEIPFLQKFHKLGLYSLQEVLESAAKDKDVKILYLKFGKLEGGWASLSSLYDAIAKFKRTGKTIVAYSESYTEKSYYLASLANKIYLYPAGAFEFNGLATVQPFFSGFFQKFDVSPTIFRVGKFKSAVEPFIMDKMSRENKEQTEGILADIWQNFTEKLHKNRQIPLKVMTDWVDKGTIRNAEDAFKHKLVDGLVAEGEVLEKLKMAVTGKKGILIKKKEEIPSKDEKAENGEKDPSEMMISWSSYSKFMEKEKTRSTLSENQIALVYVLGEILDGKGQDGTVGSESMVKMMRELARDESVKAIVLRIDSPGGSALAADVLWNEIESIKSKKPVVASLGDVAASGAYYLASNCDFIMARPNTITGSIGVFGIFVNLKKFFHDNLGITFDQVITGPFADLGHVHRPMSKAEKDMVQAEVNRTYQRFLERVAKGRKFPEVSQVESMAEGRVWSGKKAKELGLVDDWGSIPEAVAKASQLATLGTDYYVESYPKKRNALLDLLMTFQETQAISKPFEGLKEIPRIFLTHGPLMIWPFKLKID